MATEQELRAQERARWLVERRSGIGGSDAAAVLGVSPWRRPIDVWQEKLGLAEPGRDSEAIWWGRELEPLIRRRYMERTGLMVTPGAGMYRHREHDCLLANVDGIIAGLPAPRGLEIKTASARLEHEWGPDGSDEVPTHYAIQCCHYMLVTGFRSWDLAALIGGSDFRVYTLRADAEMEAFLAEAMLAFWRDHVVARVPPPLDGSESARVWLHRRYPAETLPLADADAEAEAWARRLADARDLLESAREERELCENFLKAAIGERAGLRGGGWRATWKRDRDSERVDWKAYAHGCQALLAAGGKELIEQALGRLGVPDDEVAGVLAAWVDRMARAAARIKADATETTPGSRRFIYVRRTEE